MNSTATNPHYNQAMIKAHARVSRAIKHGELVDLAKIVVKCSDCQKRATEYDHRDYSKPLEVSAVCSGCNVKRGPAAFLEDSEITYSVFKTVKIRKQDYEALRKYAGKVGRPLAQVLGRAIKSYCGRNGQ